MTAHAVHEAAEDELAPLPTLEAAADSIFAEAGYPPLPPPGEVAELSRAWRILVAGRPARGFARLEIVDGCAHLEQLAVDPAHFRRGIGTALVLGAIATATAAGYPRITLCTFADVAWNGPFYRALGFTELDPLTPGLRELREHERAAGLDAMGRRVVLARETDYRPRRN